jgi:guanylate kinase
LYIFIAPPSLDDLRRRLQVRGTDAPAEIEARVRIAAEEIAAAHSAVAGRPLYDHVIVNEVLSDAIRRVEELIGV